MIDRLDQIFVFLLHRILGYMPGGWQVPVGVILSAACIVCLYPALFALAVLMERKGLGRMQNRYGPNRVGPFGLLQPAADGIKALIKEDVVPAAADQLVHFFAPVVFVAAAFLGYSVLPIGRNMVLVNLNAGVLFFFAVGSVVELSVFMAG